MDIDRNGCDTRNDILARDLTGETFKPGTHNCVVLTGTLADPYSGRHDRLPARPGHQRRRPDRPRRRAVRRLAEGRPGLDAARRTAFANDPLNLLAVDGPLNMQKGDGDAATWLPPNKAYRCAYVARQVAVKVSYGLWMTQAEKNAIATVLSACPNEPLPGGVVADVQRRPAPAPAPAPARCRPAPAPRSRAGTRSRSRARLPPRRRPRRTTRTATRSGPRAPRPSRRRPGYSSKLDRDGDGIGCE